MGPGSLKWRDFVEASRGCGVGKILEPRDVVSYVDRLLHSKR